MTGFFGIILQLLILLIVETRGYAEDKILKPEINIPSESYVVEVGRKDLLLECHVQGAMPVNITWMLRGKLIKENENYNLKTIKAERNIHTFQLWISVIDTNVFGDYVCLATNAFGKQQRTISLNQDIQITSANRRSCACKVQTEKLTFILILCAVIWCKINGH